MSTDYVMVLSAALKSSILPEESTSDLAGRVVSVISTVSYNFALA
jgi:hypothetical protein